MRQNRYTEKYEKSRGEHKLLFARGKRRAAAKAVPSVLAAALLAGSFGIAPAAWADDELYPEIWHADVDFSDMKIEEISLETLDKLCAEAEKLSEKEGQEDEVREKILAMLDAYDHLDTQTALIAIRSDQDVQNEEYADASTDAYLLDLEADDHFQQSLQKIQKNGYGDLIVELFGEEYADGVREYTALTEEEEAFLEKETDLQNEYDSIMLDEYTYMLNGKEWTEDDLAEAWFLSYDEYLEIYYGIAAERNRAAVPIYQELLQLWQEEAEFYDYDNYMEYAFNEVYYRDYTTEDAQELCSQVKKELVPLYSEMIEEVYGEGSPEISSGGAVQEELLEKVEPYIGEVDERLTEAWDYLKKYHLYDLQDTGKGTDGAYTTKLAEYQAPFIYGRTDGSYYDLETVVHEFGHFNAMYHREENAANYFPYIDVDEIQSQGLELLFMPYWGEIMGSAEKGDETFRVILMNKLDAVVSGCMVYEMEYYAMTHPDASADELNESFGRIAEEYEYTWDLDDGAYYSWVDISHLFESPGYYISYVTSSMASMEIWEQSLEDRDAAIENYMQVTAADAPLCETLESCGLRDIFSGSTVRAVADAIAGQQGLEGRYDDREDEDYGEEWPEELPDDWEEEFRDERDDDWYGDGGDAWDEYRDDGSEDEYYDEYDDDYDDPEVGLAREMTEQITDAAEKLSVLWLVSIGVAGLLILVFLLIRKK